MNPPSEPTCVRTVLVIASDPANMQLMTLLLANRDDFKVLTAVNGRDGMELALIAQPQVVVLDTGLSDICASEVLKALLSDPLTWHIPVIAVSSEARSSHIQAGLQAGFYRYLTKPFKLTDLITAIDCSLGVYLI